MYFICHGINYESSNYSVDSHTQLSEYDEIKDDYKQIINILYDGNKYCHKHYYLFVIKIFKQKRQEKNISHQKQ